MSDFKINFSVSLVGGGRVVYARQQQPVATVAAAGSIITLETGTVYRDGDSGAKITVKPPSSAITRRLPLHTPRK